MAASFLIAKGWKQPESPSAGARDKLWSIQTMDYCAAIKNKMETPRTGTEQSPR